MMDHLKLQLGFSIYLPICFICSIAAYDNSSIEPVKNSKEIPIEYRMNSSIFTVFAICFFVDFVIVFFVMVFYLWQGLLRVSFF